MCLSLGKPRQGKKRPMKNHRKVLVFLLILFIGLILNKVYGWGDYLKNIGNLNSVEAFVEENYGLSVLIYILLTIVGSSVLVLPGATFALVSSAAFGPLGGVVYCLIGTTIGAVVSFLLSRYLLKDSVMDLVRKNDKLYNIIFQADSERETLILMITRILPIFPFNLQNFAYGITNISIVKYTIGTFLFMVPGILIFVLATDGILNKSNRKLVLVSLLIIVLLVLVIGSYLYKKYKLLTVGGKDER